MSTRRADFRAALLAILDDFKAAHPEWIRQTYDARPTSYYPPCAYVGPMSEPRVVIEFGSRLRRPDIQASLILVEGVYDNAETLDRLNEKGDALLTYLVTQHARISGSTLLEPTGGLEEVDYSVTDAKGITSVYATGLIPVRLNALD